MKRALVLVEGPTEEAFVKQVLRPHFWTRGLDLAPTILVTKPVKAGGSFRGGLVSFRQFDSDLRRLLGSRGALVTTMIDYYRLPEDFPGMEDRPSASAIRRVQHVEAAIAARFKSPPNLIPYLSLHEFEALLFVSPEELSSVAASPDAKDLLLAIREKYPNPEDINERPGYSPAERILELVPGFRKRLHGPATLERIGLPALRSACPHFAGWIDALEVHASKSG